MTAFDSAPDQSETDMNINSWNSLNSHLKSLLGINGH